MIQFGRSHVVASVVGALVVFVGLAFWIAAPRTSYTTATVTRGPITQEVLATGNVQSPTTANLAFKASGKLTALNVSVGQHVAAGRVLASQDASVLEAQLAQAQANVAAATAALRTLQDGATSQTVAVYEAQLAAANQSLDNAYATIRTTLADAYAKANDAVTNQLAQLFVNGQTDNPSLSFSISDFTLATRIVAERAQANTELSEWQQEVPSGDSSHGTLDTLLARADAHAAALQKLLVDAVAAAGKSTGLTTTTATTYRTNAATGLSEVNTALSNIQTLEHTISLGKTSVTTAQANLNLTTASSTQNSIDAQQAVIAAAQANAKAISAQIKDLEIVAPVDGVVTDTTGIVGEVVGPSTTVVALMPDAKLEVKADVSEDNIVNVSVGDKARISLDAFPQTTTFEGTVSAVDPAQTLKGGAVYYQTTLVFDKNYSGIRPGMTANVYIETASSSDALIVPASALSSLEGSTTVQVLENGAPVTRSVTTGIEGQNGMVEVLSGLSQGDKVITGS